MRQVIGLLVVSAIVLGVRLSAAQIGPRQPVPVKPSPSATDAPIPAAVVTGDAGGHKPDSADREAQLESQVRRLQEELAATQDAGRKLLADAIKKYSQLRSDEIIALNESVATQRKQVAEMQARIVELTGSIAELADQLTAARERLRVKELELRRVRTTAAGREAAADADLKLDGIVKEVADDGQLVQISLGSDDGVTRRMTFEVHRDAKYLGRIEILQATADTAVGKVLPEFKKGKIQANDRVTTKLTGAYQ